MRLGPFHITRLRRHKIERRYELPWDVLTLEHLSDPTRAIIARCARAAAKDYLAEHREQLLELFPDIPTGMRCPHCRGYVRGHQWIGADKCSVNSYFTE